MKAIYLVFLLLFISCGDSSSSGGGKSGDRATSSSGGPDIPTGTKVVITQDQALDLLRSFENELEDINPGLSYNEVQTCKIFTKNLDGKLERKFVVLEVKKTPNRTIKYKVDVLMAPAFGSCLFHQYGEETEYILNRKFLTVDENWDNFSEYTKFYKVQSGSTLYLIAQYEKTESNGWVTKAEFGMNLSKNYATSSYVSTKAFNGEKLVSEFLFYSKQNSSVSVGTINTDGLPVHNE